MASFTPYAYIQCPCVDSVPGSRSPDGASTPTSHSSPEDDERDFDPRSPRSNYSLYPIEYMLYCEDCHTVRCERCVTEEVVTLYCPSCLFEVGNSSVKTEGNRCTRSCFQCPICIGPLSVQSLESTPAAPEPSLLSADHATATGPAGPWILCCSYCNWNSSEIGVKFDKPQGIFAQLSKLRSGYDNHHSRYTSSGDGDTYPTKRDADGEPGSTKARFASLKSFYQTQMSNENPNSGLGSTMDYGYGSPGALSRIMSLYSGNTLSSAKPKSKPTIMREADTTKEGLFPAKLDDTSVMSGLRSAGYDGTATRAQVNVQVEEGARFATDLWPIPYVLRTKRTKRCPSCRHILSKPEAKVSNTRWRMRLIAGNYIPSITIKPLIPVGAPGGPTTHLLTPVKPVQYLLTFKNPIFETIKVTLATPAVTPGRFASKVTLLCPQFQIGANSDDYNLDEVLKDRDKDPQRKRSDTTGQQVEAGKEWDSGRNWVSVVVEVVPSSIQIEPKPTILKKLGEVDDLGPLREDEDIVEIPIFVHLEWEASADQVTGKDREDKETKEKKELAYWCALGIGRISPE
ncbi:dynactin p62 family protein [Pseudomassariella vexata]|uniref:Dynactin subunit 4 n=1 Tax=Pseudomassariella vexata TaxID=1141098 RepID=A0A1Y2DVQ7_9PEZI|nr:dynactin p62 family protein [Pseudomassariella vexata]ORY63382.1 dynactin p62 family protein [Pseudomassariella vexata]